MPDTANVGSVSGSGGGSISERYAKGTRKIAAMTRVRVSIPMKAFVGDG